MSLKHPWRRYDRRSLGFRATAFVLAFVFLGVPLLGTASALNIGAPIITGKITAGGNFAELILPEIGSFQPINPGDLIFGDSLEVFVFNTHNSNQTVPINYAQYVGANNTQYTNVSVFCPALQLCQATLTLPSSLAEIPATVDVQGAVWDVYHETPLSLLPPGILNIGGLDLVIIVILIEFIVIAAPLTMLARRLVRKALYAPHFSLIMWGHVIGFSLLTAIVVDYQLVDQSLGGVSYFIYPVIFALMWFFWSMHLFNRAEVIEILKPDTMNGHRLRYLRWTQLIGRLKDGRVVVIGTRWRDFLYGCLGHFATLIPIQSEATLEGRPVGAPVENRKVLAEHEKKPAVRRWRPGKEVPTDDFEVINTESRDEPTHIFWVDSQDPVEVKMPYASWHKTVDVPRKLDRHGNVIDAHREKKLTWPHIVEPVSTIRLAGIHYVDVPVAAIGWATTEDTYKLLEKRAFQVYVLRSKFQSETDRVVEERIAEVMALVAQGQKPMTPDEAYAETEKGRWGDSRRGDRNRYGPTEAEFPTPTGRERRPGDGA